MSNVPIALKRTLAYFAIFNHSATQAEIHKYLLFTQCSFKELKPLIKNYPEFRELSKLYKRKLQHAKQLASLANKFPFVKAVFLTGDLAAGVAKESSDADFLIIVKQGFNLRRASQLLNLVFSLLLLRKSKFNRAFIRLIRGMRTSACFNIFLSEQALSMSKDKQNLFVAEEIARVKPIVDKNGYYEKFLQANCWVGFFLPNWMNCATKKHKPSLHQPSITNRQPPTKFQLFLHTSDLTDIILKKYVIECEKRCVDPGCLTSPG